MHKQSGLIIPTFPTPRFPRELSNAGGNAGGNGGGNPGDGGGGGGGDGAAAGHPQEDVADPYVALLAQ